MNLDHEEVMLWLLMIVPVFFFGWAGLLLFPALCVVALALSGLIYLVQGVCRLCRIKMPFWLDAFFI